MRLDVPEINTEYLLPVWTTGGSLIELCYNLEFYFKKIQELFEEAASFLGITWLLGLIEQNKRAVFCIFAAVFTWF